MVEVDGIDFMPEENYKPGDVLIRGDKIQERIRLLGLAISDRYKDRNLLVVSLLKGGVTVTIALLDQLHKNGIEDSSLTFISVRRYPTGTQATSNPVIHFDTDINPTGRHVLIIDDILDTGGTIQEVHQHIIQRGAISVESFVLLDKPDRRENLYQANYVGFTIPNVWVQGYGMDSDEYGRANPDIIVGPKIPIQLSLQQN